MSRNQRQLNKETAVHPGLTERNAVLGGNGGIQLNPRKLLSTSPQLPQSAATSHTVYFWVDSRDCSSSPSPRAFVSKSTSKYSWFFFFLQNTFPWFPSPSTWWSEPTSLSSWRQCSDYQPLEIAYSNILMVTTHIEAACIHLSDHYTASHLRSQC